MARTTTSERQLLRAASDAGFRVLPPMVRLLWFELLAFAAGAPEKGRLRFLQSVTASVSRLLTLPETEVETGLETLRLLGLVELDAETNSLWLPGARAHTARAQSAQINGLRGGRPKKNETAEQAFARRQGHMALPIAGGLQETHGTEAEPSRESSRAATSSIPILEEKVGTAGEEAWVSLRRQVAEIARLDMARLQNSEPMLRMWLALPGATAARICDAVRKVVSRSKFDGSRHVSLNYFTAAVTEHLASGPDLTHAGFNPRAEAEAKHRQAMIEWAVTMNGPRPRLAA